MTLAGRGYQVHQNPSKAQVAEARARTGDVGRPSRSPDYLIEGHVFDCYSPSPARSVRNIWAEVRDKIEAEQTQRVVLNLRDWNGDLDALNRQFRDWPIEGLLELAAVTRTGPIVQLVAQSEQRRS